MTWKQRKQRKQRKPFDPKKPVIKTSPKQALQREWFVRQGQILGGFHCMYSAARQMELHGFAFNISQIRIHLINANDEWFAREKEKLNAPK